MGNIVVALIDIPPDLTFVALAAVTIIGAILALQAKELIYGAVALAISFIGVAGFFVSLDAPYLAMLQIAIYVGAIVVLILFTIMLVSREGGEMKDQTPGGQGSVGLWLAGLLALAISGVAALAGPGLPSNLPAGSLPVAELGPTLATQYPIPLIVLALLISATLLGALVLAKVER
ncbi:MAG TPA: NADH-quinone oxidoreductase subunit J [Candidatus Saccharimonadales bacterium]|nr:NADH-quinone oxidoreductase subunit J [Candidatus Saccharimonadales bacterium]